VCSNMGKCDSSSGLCSCAEGFYGKACQFQKCVDGSTSKGADMVGEVRGRARCGRKNDACFRVLELLHGARD